MHADRIIKKSEFRPCNRSISRQQPARRPASHFLVTPGSRPPIAARPAAAMGPRACKIRGTGSMQNRVRLLAGSNRFGKVRWKGGKLPNSRNRLPCSDPVGEKACKSRNLAAGRLLAGICLYFGPLRPLFYFNSPAGSLARLAGRLASPDWPRAELEDAC